MSRSAYRQLYEGDHIDVDMKGGAGFIRVACCDCGLVHGFLIVRERGKIVIYPSRDNRRTAAYRRHHGVSITVKK